ncbi:RepB family plasmid replication initiator protein [Clostridium novyi]
MYLIKIHWFASIKYFKDEGKMAFTFAPRLKPYYLQLKNYTKYRISNIASLKSQYSIRIYELLKQYEKIKTRKLDLNHLKELLGLEIHQYPKFYDFKNRVLNVAQKELSEKTDIKFTFEEIKTGRKVTSIRFFIDQKHKKKDVEEVKHKDIIDTLGDKEDLKFVYMLLSDKLSEVDCNKLYIAANYDLKKVKRAYELSLKQRTIKNLFGWLKDCIEKQYSIPVAVTNLEENKDTFNDFPQRRYDFDDLEAKLLGIKK